MGILANLFRKKAETEENKVGGIEDFMTLIRVYYQAVMAGNLGISNINMLPDLAIFKRTLKVATQNNKLGIAEKSRCKKILMQIYGLNEGFFKEIDASIKKNCRNVNMVNSYSVPTLQREFDDGREQRDEVHNAPPLQKVTVHPNRGHYQQYSQQEQLERRSYV